MVENTNATIGYSSRGREQRRRLLLNMVQIGEDRFETPANNALYARWIPYMWHFLHAIHLIYGIRASCPNS